MTQEALSQLIECSRLLGYTQAKKALGTYTEQDSRFEVAMYKSIHEHEAKIKEALAKEKALQALHNENERLGLYKDAYAQPEQEPFGFAGVKIWIGNRQAVRILTQTELHHAIEPWLLVELNAEMCIKELKENT